MFPADILWRVTYSMEQITDLFPWTWQLGVSLELTNHEHYHRTRPQEVVRHNWSRNSKANNRFFQPHMLSFGNSFKITGFHLLSGLKLWILNRHVRVSFQDLRNNKSPTFDPCLKQATRNKSANARLRLRFSEPHAPPPPSPDCWQSRQRLPSGMSRTPPAGAPRFAPSRTLHTKGSWLECSEQTRVPLDHAQLPDFVTNWNNLILGPFSEISVDLRDWTYILSLLFIRLKNLYLSCNSIQTLNRDWA